VALALALNLVLPVSPELARPARAAGSKSIRDARQRLRDSKVQKKRSPARAVYAPGSSEEPFKVTAIARTVGKSIRPMDGGGVLRCATTGENAFKVALAADVTYGNGSKKDHIKFAVDRDFNLAAGNKVTVGAPPKDEFYNDYAAKYKHKILDTVSLAYLIKFRSPTNGNGSWAPQVYAIGDRVYTLSYKKTAREIEVTLTDNQGANPIGKFFLKPVAHGHYPFRMFRIYTRDNVSVEFDILS
jgi:hypothetical protein